MPRGTPLHGYGGTRRKVLEALVRGPVTIAQLEADGLRRRTADGVLRDLAQAGVVVHRKIQKGTPGRQPFEFVLVQP